MGIKGYEQMIVWQKAMDLAVEVYRIVKFLPKEELYALSDQMRRAVVSIPSNIAEGQSRNSTKEFIQFLNIAAGSNAELFTHLLICEKVGYISQKELETSKNLSSEIARMISSIIPKLKSSI